ncbi:MAG TPA: AAA family ATPase [Gaiellaceae bacterium]|nr:AAA family ATPase [Gaiellaceae bacterium]
MKSVTSAVVGREEEAAALAAFLGGEGRALVLVGEAGMGKTTLWQEGLAMASAEGVRVLAARASEAELQLPFVALADLLEDVDLAAVPGVLRPQRRSLEAALFRAEQEEAELSVPVAAGFTAVLRALAADERLLVAVDDVPWLDRASAEALTFAARRLGGCDVRFLLARRTGGATPLEGAFNPPGADSLELGPLSLGATRTLLAQRVGLTLPRRVLRRVFESAGGNPLFALELGRLLRERGTPEIGAELPIPELVDDVFGPRVAGLAVPLRRALLAVALSPTLSRLQLAGVVDPLALEDAVRSGLLTLDGERVRVSHPLLAAAARKHSAAAERRDLHLALAEVVGDTALRAQHLALASAKADAELAERIAETAAAALARGATHEAVEVAEHALRLTPPDDVHYGARLLDLARYFVIAGEMPRARQLLEHRTDDFARGEARACAYLVLAECADAVDEALRLLDMALVEADDDAELRAQLLAEKAIMHAATRFSDLDEAEALATQALEAAQLAGPEQERWALCALAWVRLVRGRPLTDLEKRTGSLPQSSSLYETSIERVEGTRLVCRGEFEEARALFERLRALAEERGEARSGWMMYHGLTEIELRAGNAGAAAKLMALSQEWAAFEDGDGVDPPRMAILEAVRGRPEEAERWAAETIRNLGPTGVRREETEGWRARGIVALLRHEPERAVEALRPIWEHTVQEGIDEPGVWPMAPDLVEALVEIGELHEALTVTDRLERLAGEQDHPWGLASAMRCRAMLSLATAYDEDAAALLREAADAYGARGLRFDQARSLLFLGRVQRRNRKWAAARRSLDEAAEVFEALGGDGWAEQARAALERTGARRPVPKGDLTPSEERVARLAAQGLSNKEIAAALVVSVYTVEKHLSHVYAKLGVRSRAQLAPALG